MVLETNKDGFGAWKITDILGRSWIELPEWLQGDLMTWRWLSGIGETIRKKRNG